MKNLSKHIAENWLNTLKLIDKNITDEIYAFSFFVYDYEDDPRRPTLTIGYNTYANFKKQVNTLLTGVYLLNLLLLDYRNKI